MPRKRAIERDTIVQYWHYTDINDYRQLRILQLLSEESNFNDNFVVSQVIDEDKLVSAQLF